MYCPHCQGLPALTGGCDHCDNLGHLCDGNGCDEPTLNGLCPSCRDDAADDEAEERSASLERP